MRVKQTLAAISLGLAAPGLLLRRESRTRALLGAARLERGPGHLRSVTLKRCLRNESNPVAFLLLPPAT